MDFNEIINSSHKDLVRGKPAKKRVTCLRCAKEFNGSINIRRCGKCSNTSNPLNRL